MYALTVKQPWAQAIAQFGKNVENRKTRPPAALIGQRIAIHVSKTWGINEAGIPLPGELLDWTQGHCKCGDNGRLAPPPHAGRIIATARLVGAIEIGGAESVMRAPPVKSGASDAEAIAEFENDGLLLDAWKSRWATGPWGWVLADVVMLLEPVGQECPQCTGHGSLGHLNLPASYPVLCDMCNGVGTEPIRGQLGCWKVAPELAAQVQEQEQMARGRR